MQNIQQKLSQSYLNVTWRSENNWSKVLEKFTEIWCTFNQTSPTVDQNWMNNKQENKKDSVAVVGN